MTGFIKKRHCITCFFTLQQMGGLGLVVAVALAKPGTPFLTVLAKRTVGRWNR
jgi:hypothetical protein